MRIRRRAVVIAAALAMVAGQAPPATAARGDVAFSATNCSEGVSFFLLDPEIVRPFVPEPFEVRLVNQTPPLAEVAVSVTSCEGLVAGGGSEPLLFSDVGVYIEDVDESPGDWHYYGLWHATTHSQLARSLRGLGIAAPFVKDSTYTSTTGVADVAASIPLRSGPYEVRLVAPAPTSAFGFRPSVWWYSARDGSHVRALYTVEQEGGATSGSGTIETREGSPIARMLGGPSRHSDSTMIARYGTLKATITTVAL